MTGDSQGVWDGQRLQQLLGNLVVNALKYGARDTLGRVDVTCDETHIHIDVRNRGPAIERATLARMFDPLMRRLEHRSEAGPAGGLGLGLYIASEIAKAHHGD